MVLPGGVRDLIGFAVRKLAVAASTIFVASVVIFWAIEILPQDPAVSALGPFSTAEQRAAFDQRMHLDRPAVVRYVTWLSGFMRGDFGKSVISDRSIAPQLFNRLRFTVLLAVISLLIGTVGALPLAVLAARNSGRAVDVFLSSLTLGVSALPEYVLGILLLLLLAVKVQVFPVVSNGIATGDFGALGLPVCTLSLAGGAYIFRLARVSVAENLAAPYVRTAILAGFNPARIFVRHILPNASVAVVNVVALNALYLLGGVIVVENVFAYPGLGTLLVEAVGSKDFTLVEGTAVTLSALFVAITLVADGIVLMLSPRLRAHHGMR